MSRDSIKQKFTQLKQKRRADVEEYYHKAEHAHEDGKHFAWTCGGSLSELMNSMDIVNLRPASYCAVAAAKGSAREYCDISASSGFSPDLCSYGRVAIGMMISGKAPYGAMPIPDVIVNDATLCDCDNKGWETFALHYKVPFYRFEGPMRFADKLPSRYIKWRVEEIKECAKFLEIHTGRKLDLERFKETMKVAAETRNLYRQLQEYRKLIPSPVDHREISNAIFYLANDLGSQKAIDYLRLFIEIARESAEMGIGAIPEEKYRVYFDGISIWHDLQLFKYLQERGVAVVWDSYSNLEAMAHYAYGLSDDAEKPFESIALKYLYQLNTLSIRLVMKAVKKAVSKWRCGGAILCDNKSCKPYSTANKLKAKMLEECGVPTIIIDVDHADPSGYSPRETRERIDTLLGMLETRRCRS